MYTQPIRHEMAVTLRPHLSKQSSSVFMNSNGICFLASDRTCASQSILFVSGSTCRIVAEVRQGCTDISLSRHMEYAALLRLHTSRKRCWWIYFVLPVSLVTPAWPNSYWITQWVWGYLVGSSSLCLTSHTHTCPSLTSITGPHSVP